MKTKRTTLLLGALALMSLSARGQFVTDWFTIGGGAGTIGGGAYTLNGTVGQPDASAAMSGGNYTVVGGFWSFVAAIQAPALSVERVAGGVRVFWPLPTTGFVLDQTPAMASPPAGISWS